MEGVNDHKNPGKYRARVWFVPVRRTGLLGSIAMGRLPFMSRAVALPAGTLFWAAGAKQHDTGAPRPDLRAGLGNPRGTRDHVGE